MRPVLHTSSPPVPQDRSLLSTGAFSPNSWVCLQCRAFALAFPAASNVFHEETVFIIIRLLLNLHFKAKPYTACKIHPVSSHSDRSYSDTSNCGPLLGGSLFAPIALTPFKHAWLTDVCPLAMNGKAHLGLSRVVCFSGLLSICTPRHPLSLHLCHCTGC